MMLKTILLALVFCFANRTARADYCGDESLGCNSDGNCFEISLCCSTTRCTCTMRVNGRTCRSCDADCVSYDCSDEITQCNAFTGRTCSGQNEYVECNPTSPPTTPTRPPTTPTRPPSSPTRPPSSPTRSPTTGGQPTPSSATVPGSSNDLCQDAYTMIPDGSSVQGSTIGSSADDGYVEGCGGLNLGNSPGVWFKVQGTGTTLIASTCDSDFDTQLHVFQGRCGSLDCVRGDDDSSTCGLASQVTWATETGQTYYLLLEGYDTARGSYVMTLESDPPITFSSEKSSSSSAGAIAGGVVGGLAGVALIAGAAIAFFLYKRHGNNGPGPFQKTVGPSSTNSDDDDEIETGIELPLEEFAPVAGENSSTATPSTATLETGMSSSTATPKTVHIQKILRSDGSMKITETTTHPDGSQTKTITVEAPIEN